MVTRCTIHILIAALLVSLSSFGEAARLGSRSKSPSASPSVSKTTGIREEAASDARKGISVSLNHGTASSANSGGSAAAPHAIIQW